MSKNFKNYDLSFIEVVIEKLRAVYDINFESKEYLYSKDPNFLTFYGEYILPYGKQFLKILDQLKGESLVLIHLPITESNFREIGNHEKFDNILADLHPDIATEMSSNKDYFYHKMNKGPLNDLPLLFPSKLKLYSFLKDNHDFIDDYFLENVLLFPLELDWAILFDYELEVIQFSLYPYIFEKLKMCEPFSELLLSRKEFDRLIAENRSNT